MERVSLDTIERGTCDGCAKSFPGWALYEPVDGEPGPDAICGACIERVANENATVVPVVLAPWETEPGKYLKAQRNLALSYDQSGWVLSEGAPVTPACREAFLAYRAKLNRMTIDYLPEDWVWPERPILAYD